MVWWVCIYLYLFDYTMNLYLFDYTVNHPDELLCYRPCLRRMRLTTTSFSTMEPMMGEWSPPLAAEKSYGLKFSIASCFHYFSIASHGVHVWMYGSLSLDTDSQFYLSLEMLSHSLHTFINLGCFVLLEHTLFWVNSVYSVCVLSLIHIWRCRRDVLCRSRWSPYH